MRGPFIFTSLGVVRGGSKRGNRKCGPENIDLLVDMVIYMLVLVWCTVSHDIIAYIIYLYAFALSCQP